MLDQRYSDNNQSRRDIPSFIEPRPPLISNPFMRPRPQKGTNLLELFEEDSDIEEPELVQVYLRMKPHHTPNNLYEVKSDRCLITSVDTATAGHGRRTQHNVSKMYTFSQIFGPEATQKEIFEHVIKDNLKKLPDGQSCTLLTYGASGSGKTYTLMGTVASPGLVPRSLEYVFRVVDAAQQPLFKPADGGAEKLNYAEQDYELQWVKRLRKVSAPLRDKYRRMSAGLCSDLTASSLDLSNRARHYVWVSFVEIYNEGIYDLLATTDRSNASKLRIREDTNGQVYVKGATQAFVRTGEEAYDVMVAGKHNLQVAATGVHAHSSRSHCIFTITMLTETESGPRSSCVRLCDLAGCERARRTRNTGARMAESRAINSSLHVLERCLHTLRRRGRANTATCVPYRESKLTRLLGAGLSGARGEAVSMVVTLNPAAEYAHETKHVLQLAAVARDIQVNNTIAESTLETTQDTTIHSSAEVMKLRADNERLHFELLQAQARNKELTSVMEEKQQEAANTMRELVEEAKDMTRQYYEAQIEALKTEMEEMSEEYEERLSKATGPPASTNTPSRALQNKVAELMTEIAILEEKLTAEHLARARAEEEVQHLRACIEERDEKAFEENSAQQNVKMLSDSEHESDEEDDPCNESLEPTFKKDDINKSILQMNNGHNHDHSNHSSEHSDQDMTENTIGNEDGSILNKSNDTLKDGGADEETTKESEYVTGEEDSGITNKTGDTHDSTNIDNIVKEFSEKNLISDETNTETNKSLNQNNHEIIKKVQMKVENDLISIKESNLHFDYDTKPPVRGTYFVKCDDNNALNSEDATGNKSNSLTRGIYFVNDKDIKISTNLSVNKDASLKDSLIEEESKDIIGAMSPKTSESFVSRMIKSKKSHSINSSLAQFEQLEMAANDFDEIKEDDKNEFIKLDIVKEKKANYFDDKPHDKVTEDLIPHVKTNDKVYFDNINVNIDNASNKKVNEILNDARKELDNTRSPSIVKDEVGNEYKPSTMKILLGESFTRQHDVLSSVHKNKILHKKQESLDIFEGLDSPCRNIKNTESHNVVQSAKKSIEKLVLEQKVAINQMPNIKKEILVKTTISEESSINTTNAKPDDDCVPLTKTSKKLEVSENKPEESEFVAPVAKSENKSNDLKVKPEIEDPKFNETRPEPTNNTIEEFENICKDLTAQSVTEFDLLVQDATMNNTNTEKVSNKEPEETKYNLRHKQNKSESVKFSEKIDKEEDEVLLESHAKCESKTRTTTKRSLRLRRRKNQNDSEDKSETENDKLKDIVNLQKEFSDVTLDVPAPVKEVKDIISPVKSSEVENVAPILEIQSCPSKSVTRSRRKLFTPRAEPLDEDEAPGHSGERLYVPRPSYHRVRARRKL